MNLAGEDLQHLNEPFVMVTCPPGSIRQDVYVWRHVAENCGLAEADLGGCTSLDDLLVHVSQTDCLADMLASLRTEVSAC